MTPRTPERPLQPPHQLPPGPDPDRDWEPDDDDYDDEPEELNQEKLL